MEQKNTPKDQITIYYNPDDVTQEKTVAHAKGTGKEILAISYADAPTAYNIWTPIYESLKGRKGEFFDRNHEDYEKLVGDQDLSFEAWHKIATHNPSLISAAVAKSGDRVMVINAQTDIYKLQDLGPEGAEQKVQPEDKVAAENRAYGDAPDVAPEEMVEEDKITQADIIDAKEFSEEDPRHALSGKRLHIER